MARDIGAYAYVECSSLLAKNIDAGMQERGGGEMREEKRGTEGERDKQGERKREGGERHREQG